MEIALTPITSISPNFTTPVGTQDYMNSEKNLKKDAQKAREEGKESSNDLSSPTKLSDDEKRLVKELQSRDMEVRSHESAHQTGGASTGAASYSYQQGPDGKMYAIGGEVSISYKASSNPQETIQNTQAIIAAAMAPSNPSPQDHAVASSARIMQMKAQQQLTRQRDEEMLGKEIYKNESTNKPDNDNSDKTNTIDIPA